MKKLLTLLLLIGVSHNASGMDLVKLPPNNVFLFKHFSQNKDFELKLSEKKRDPFFKEEIKEELTNWFLNSNSIETDENGAIKSVNLSGLVQGIIASLTPEIEKSLSKNNEKALRNLGHKTLKELENSKVEARLEKDRIGRVAQEEANQIKREAQATLNAQTFWQRYPKINTFISFGVGTGVATGIMAALCWNSSFETKFTVLKQYLGFMTKAAASVPTNVA
jgi:hypothetical protein